MIDLKMRKLEAIEDVATDMLATNKSITSTV